MELGELDAAGGTPVAALKTSPLHLQHVAAGRQVRRVRRLVDALGVRRSRSLG